MMLPPVDGPWGYRKTGIGRPAGMSDEEANNYALRDMCDYGARQVMAGKCNLLKLSVWHSEKDYVARYMAERYPTVKYFWG